MDAPVFVAGCACLMCVRDLFCFMPLHGAGAGECARRRSNFLLRRQKKVTKEKATPLSASLRCASGNLRCSRPAGSRSNSLRCTALKQSRSLIRWPLRSSAHTEGQGHPNSRTSIRAIALLGLVLRAQAPGAGRSAGWVERSDDPCGCPAPVAAPAAGRLRGGTCVGARVLRELTRRGCPNGALQRAVSFAAHPATAPTQVCPFAKRRGRRLGIAFLLGTFLWRSKEKYLACRGDNPAPALGTGMRPNQPTSPSFDRLNPNGLGNCMRELSIK